MIKAILTGEAVRKARGDVGLSQRKLAEGAGVNRHILSQFEQQKIVPKDDFLRKIKAFLEGRGYDFGGVSDEDEADTGGSSSPTPPRSSLPKQPGSGSVDTDRRVLDGYVVANGIDEDDVEDALLELEQLEQRIEELTEKEIVYESQFFGFDEDEISDRCEECQDELKSLTARAFCLVRKLQGHWAVDVCPDDKVDDNPETQGDWLSQTFADLFSFEAEQEVDEEDAA